LFAALAGRALAGAAERQRELMDAVDLGLVLGAKRRTSRRLPTDIGLPS